MTHSALRVGSWTPESLMKNRSIFLTSPTSCMFRYAGDKPSVIPVLFPGWGMPSVGLGPQGENPCFKILCYI